jgi:hypothetical protein
MISHTISGEASVFIESAEQCVDETLNPWFNNAELDHYYNGNSDTYQKTESFGVLQ